MVDEYSKSSAPRQKLTDEDATFFARMKRDRDLKVMSTIEDRDILVRIIEDMIR
jgi:hypothetical protein